MGSLYGGWATPSEAGGVGAVLSLLCVMTIYKVYQPKRLWKIFVKALNESSMILMIMAAALLFAYVSSDLYATQALGLISDNYNSRPTTIKIPGLRG